MMGEAFSKPHSIYTFNKQQCRKEGREVGWWTEFLTEHSAVGFPFFKNVAAVPHTATLYTMPYYSQEEIILDPHAHNAEPS